MINARGMKTRFGGAIMLPAVVDAMVAASKSSVYMEELQDVIGARLATMTRNEAAMVTNGAAAGILLAIAAAMTGDDRKKMERLPDTSGMKNEVIVQRRLRFNEDCAMRQTGARLIELAGAESSGLAELEAALGPRTAAIFTTEATGPGVIPISRLVPIARRHGVPLIVDNAGGLPPAENLWKFTAEMGADLAIFSGGKGLRGPQGSGLVVGNKQLIEAMKLQASPHCYIGRPLKVGKEEMVGLYTAVECLLAASPRERADLHEKRRRHIERRLGHFSFLRFRHEADRLSLQWDETARGVTAGEIATRMRSGNSPIECSGGGDGLHFNVENLQTGDDEIIAARLAEILTEGRAR
jgi:L-seryl-tRNA(Ser) seleniumtransferase